MWAKFMEEALKNTGTQLEGSNYIYNWNMWNVLGGKELVKTIKMQKILTPNERFSSKKKYDLALRQKSRS